MDPVGDRRGERSTAPVANERPLGRSRRTRVVVVAVMLLVVVVAVGVRPRVHLSKPFTAELATVSSRPWTQDWPRDPPSADIHRVELDVAPDGTGDACGVSDPCALTTARDHLRALPPDPSRDAVVRLAGGTYRLTSTFALTAADSGPPGHPVRYVAADPGSGAPPVLSGAVTVTGWTLADPATGIWSAEVDPSLDTRQLFVGGQRATRARGPVRPSGWKRTADGFTAPDASMATWANPSDLEIVSFSQWKSLRCPVGSITGREVHMAQPCWRNANAHDRFTMTEVTWVENARELLDEPGEWYLDRSAHRLYYLPRTGEDLTAGHTTIVAPNTESLVTISGSAEAPAHDIELRGITFAESTWRSPSTPRGYPVLQAGWFLDAADEPPDERVLGRTPGAVSVAHATDLRFERDTFTRLGSAGLDLAAGSQRVGVVGNRFEDIASHGIQVGETARYTEVAEPPDRLDRIDIADNVVTRTGVEYRDAVGIIVTFASNTSIRHNELSHLPYTGISLGWGWGTDSYAQHNVVQANRIVDVMRVLADGGAIYTLSAQPNSYVEANVVDDQHNPYAALYLDEGTRDVLVAHNVVSRVPQWLLIWTASIRDNVIIENFSDTTDMVNEGTDNVESDNQIGLADWPVAAQAIVDHAGLDPAFADLRRQ